MVEITWGKFKGERGVVIEREGKNIMVLLESGIEIKVSSDHIKITKKKHFPFVVTCRLVQSNNEFRFYAFCSRFDLAIKKKLEITAYPEFYKNVEIFEIKEALL